MLYGVIIKKSGISRKKTNRDRMASEYFETFEQAEKYVNECWRNNYHFGHDFIIVEMNAKRCYSFGSILDFQDI